MVSLSNHLSLSGGSSFRPSFDKLKMSGVVNFGHFAPIPAR